ncbi:efflux RND transporter periplasmic adaptor subunit [Dyella sedimenti]|uniref:efflux RND transporter periplasmic adaptor subunit n=1 Tax=Dyella sedimenti TaxID=2919947 RepID=UPI00242CF31E|nr:efflux RND transporter periplasmic adaptor subunit [Dyella sedimenti]
MSTPRKRLSIALAALFVAAGAMGIYAVHGQGGEAHAAAIAGTAPAVQVDVADVLYHPITEWQSYSGRLEAIQRVEIRPQVSGRIVAIPFKDGALVGKGEVLFVIDPEPYQAAVDRAAGEVAAAEARMAYAGSDAARADRLIQSNAIARRDYDEKQNASREASANLKAARAALEAARIDLARTRVAAPVAGRVSRAELTIGNVVTAGANAPVLTTLVSVAPIYASFNVDEQTYLQYLRKNAHGDVPVDLGLADEDGYSRKGVVDSVDNHLDTTSGTIRVRARFDNADGALLPGLYARIKVGGAAPHPAILVDDSAIGTDQAKKYVLVVDQANTVHYREVTLGGINEGLRIITSGLRPNERIVVNGVQRTKPEETVQPTVVKMAAGTGAAAPSA